MRVGDFDNMRLLQEIIDLLSSDKPNLENALFKAQVLAHRLGEQEFKQWVSHEIKGYPDMSELPAYRVIPVTVMATISNFNTRYPEIQIPMMAVDKRLRGKLESRDMRQSIAVIEAWAEDDSKLSLLIAPEMHTALRVGIDKSYEIERAWGKMSAGAMKQVVVEVRSRLLDLALQIADRIPMEPQPDQIRDVSKEMQVSDIFKNAVFGDNTTIVVGGGTIQGVKNQIVTNDLDSLVAAVKALGVPDPDLKDLRQAVSEDADSVEVKSRALGPRVKTWLSAMEQKASEGAWHVSIHTAGHVLGAAILAYYGFH
jgi:hypothetical protein